MKTAARTGAPSLLNLEDIPQTRFIGPMQLLEVLG